MKGRQEDNRSNYTRSQSGNERERNNDWLQLALAGVVGLIIGAVSKFVDAGYSRRPKGHSQHQKKSAVRDPIVWATVTFIANAALVGATVALWLATRDLVRDGKDTSEQQLRAYVYLTIGSFRWPDEMRDESGKITQSPDRYGIILNVINGGKTWAQKLVVRRAVVPEPGDSDTWNSVHWNESSEAPLVLAPGQGLPLQLDEVLFSDLPDVARGKSGKKYLAWITYDDAFGAASPRQTQIMQRLNADSKGYISFGFLPSHNCADKNCPK